MSSITSMITKAKSFNASDVTYREPVVNKRGGKSVQLQLGGQPIVLQIPLMLTWGVNEYLDEKTEAKSYDMALQFPNDEYNNPESVAFLKNMQQLEKRIKSDAITNCKDWLNKTKTSPDAVDALWTPMLRYPKDKETGDFDYSRAPTLKVKLNYWDGEYKNTEIYDDSKMLLFPNDNETLPVELITKGAHVATILSCGGIWVANGKFGIIWRLFQAVVKPRATLAGKCHINLSSKDKETLIASATKQDEEDEDVVVEQLESTVVEDSDDEADTTESDKAVVDSVKHEVKALVTEDVAPKKKRVVKKTKSSD